jgi:nucleoside-diphosphate-sugar epimerase
MGRFIEQAIKVKPLKAYGNRTRKRSLTYVSATVNTILLLIRGRRSGEIYNVGNDQEAAIIDLTKLILEIIGSNAKVKFLLLPPFDSMIRSADITKLKALGFNHEVSLNNGLKRWSKRMSQIVNK